MKNKNITKNEKDIVREICKECGVSEKLIKLLTKICSDNDIINVTEQIHNFYKN